VAKEPLVQRATGDAEERHAREDACDAEVPIEDEKRRELGLEAVLREARPHRPDDSQTARLGFPGPDGARNGAQHEVAEGRAAVSVLQAARHDAQRAGKNGRHIRVLPLGHRGERDPWTL
jgi:hypothetical protein